MRIKHSKMQLFASHSSFKLFEITMRLLDENVDYILAYRQRNVRVHVHRQSKQYMSSLNVCLTFDFNFKI